MTAAVAIVAAAQLLVVAFLVYERREERRHPNPNLQALIALTDRLCQRIQAPHAATLEHDETARQRRPPEYAPPAVPPDDDEAFWASRENLADMLMDREVNGGT